MIKLMFKKIIYIIFISLCFILITQVKSYAGTFSVSCSPSSTVEPSGTVKITITGQNSTGKFTLKGSNITLSQTSVWLENSTVTVTGTAGADGKTASITITAADVADSTTGDEIKGSKTVSVPIKKKEEVKQEKKEETPKPAQSNTQTNNNKNTNQSNKPTTQQSNNTKKIEQQNNNDNSNREETETEPEEEKESHPLGIYYLYINGIKENEEKEEIKLNKEFNYNEYEYSATANKEIKKIEIQKEAYEYNDSVEIIGNTELKSGQNEIKLKLVKDDKEVIYTINILKEGQEESSQVTESTDNNKIEVQSKKDIIISMTLFEFVVLQAAIIGIEVLINITIKKSRKKFAKH